MAFSSLDRDQPLDCEEFPIFIKMLGYPPPIARRDSIAM